MGIETATFIANLNLGWPLGADTVAQGDDHLRLIKKVLKATFPGAGGQGLASAINVTEAQFNSLAGVTSPLQAQLNALEARLAAIESPTTALASANGYQKFPSGLIFQWGMAEIPASDSLAITLPIAFPTAGFQVVATALGSAAPVAFGGNVSTTTVTIFNGYTAAQNVRWMAVGH